jgi:hypothetical protein
MLALAVIVMALGLVTNAWSWHLQQTSASVEHAKMQQIAIDAATIYYYTGDGKLLGLNGDPVIDRPVGVSRLGYTIQAAPPSGADCIGSMRGTGGERVEVFVCRGL